jgi:hypothetical protein
MKNFSGPLLAALFLIVGLAVGFQTGRSSGFETGSEWALVQADILAREAGLSMPVVLDAGTFRVIMKQPRGLYRRAWRLADEHEEAKLARQEKKLAGTAF